jgi:uncharacterized protein (TIGR03435 family)
MRNMLPALKSSLFFSIFAGAAVAFAQSGAPQVDPASTRPTFDVVSIRQIGPTQTINTPHGPILAAALVKPCDYLRDRVMCQLSLRALIEEAFQLQEYEIPGPDWLDRGRYVVQATMPLDTNKDKARLMLQQTLEDRFSLKFHRELREVPVYEMVPGKHGIKLQPAGDPAHRRPLDVPSLGHGATARMGPGQFFAMAITPEWLAIYLRSFGEVDRPVVNRTGLSGEYRIDMHWEPIEDQNSLDSGKDPGFRDAVESQLGIRLNKTTAPINMFVIDHVERAPSEN